MADENPSGLGTFDLPLRLPGQYFDKETNLHYNYYRDYDPSLGRYAESDPIGLEAGPNTYAYVFGRPLWFADPFGLDVLVCFYGNAARGMGHVGFGSPGGGGTSGFYNADGESAFGGRGVVKKDEQPSSRFDSCKVIPATQAQDKCMDDCRTKRASNPGTYHLTKRNCTMYTRDCLAKCRLPTGDAAGPAPEQFFMGLPGSPQSR